MIAIVTRVEGGKISAIVRRGHRVETLYLRHDDLQVGDRVEVRRQVNNPYLVRVFPAIAPAVSGN